MAVYLASIAMSSYMEYYSMSNTERTFFFSPKKMKEQVRVRRMMIGQLGVEIELPIGP